MLKHATKFAPLSAHQFQRAHDAGFRHAEFWLSAELLEDWEAIVTLANDFPMQYALHFPNRGDLDHRHLQYAINLYHVLHCSALVIHQPMFDRFGKDLLAEDPDLKLSIENHDLPDEAALRAWAKSSPWLTLDVEHLWIYTLKDQPLKKLRRTVASLLDRYGDKLAHVHLPGYLPGYPIHRPQYCSRKMVMQVFTVLADFGFDGLVVSETLDKFQNPEELQMDVLLHRRWHHRYLEKRTNETSSQEPLVWA